MLVRIAVIEVQTRGAERRKLRGDFGRELTASLPAASNDCAERRHVGAKRAVSVHQMGHSGRRQQGPALHQHQMQADTQARVTARAGDRIGCRRRRDHQARCRQNPAAMRGLDGVVDFAGRAEVIRRDDQLLHAVSRRVRRKWKNSTPSRRRRFIISGLAIISATMEAIFEGRK